MNGAALQTGLLYIGACAGFVAPSLQHGEPIVVLADDHFLPGPLVAGVVDFPSAVQLDVLVAVPGGALNGETLLVFDIEILKTPDAVFSLLRSISEWWTVWLDRICAGSMPSRKKFRIASRPENSYLPPL
jgi:hypothetical protein